MLLSEPFGQCYPTGVPPATEKQDLTFTKFRNYPQLAIPMQPGTWNILHVNGI